MKNILTLVLFTITSFGLWGANISEVTHEQVDNKIKINYTVSLAQKGQLFDVSIYCSIDGVDQTKPLEKLTGDAGKNVLGNGVKTVVWSVLEEYGRLDAEVKFKVVAVPSITLKATTTKIAGVNISVKKCSQAKNVIELVIILKNGNSTTRFDLYTNYIKAVDNNGQELYAVDYINGSDKVTTKRPIMIGANQSKELIIHFDSTEEVAFLSLLEIETKFPNDFGVIKNIPID